MAFAIWLKTESSDNYVFALDGTPTNEEIVLHLKERLGAEYEYVCDYEFDATYKINFVLEYED